LDQKLINLLKQLNTHGYTFLDINELINYQIINSDTFLIKQIVDCLHNLGEINLKSALVRCLTKEKLTSVTKILLDEFYTADHQGYRWVVGNALYTINDPRFLNNYLEIVTNESFGDSRQMIVLLLGKANYRNVAVKNVLLPLLNDYTVANHALEALAKFKDPELFEMIQSYVSETEKDKFLRTMKQLKMENPDNKGIQALDPKGMWRWRARTARKFKKEY